VLGRREALTAARRTAGHTLESLAEAVDVDRSTAIRWESGKSEPQPRYRPKLARALGISLGRLDDLLCCGETEAPAARLVEHEERVQFVFRNPASVDLIAVAALRERIRALDASYDTTPSAKLIGEAAQWLGHVMLLERYATGRVMAALCTAEAEAAILVGELAWDASQRREHVAARHYFEQARTAALRIHDPAVEGLALLRQSIVSLYGEHDPHSGLDLAVLAAQTGAASSAVVAGLGLLHAAEGHAMLRSRRECEAALGEAEQHLSMVDVADPLHELYSPTQPGRMAGSCYLALGEDKRALRTLEEVARSFTAPSKNQAIVWGNLGLAHVRRHEIDEAMEALHRAIDVIETTRGGGGMNIVCAASRELHRCRDRPAVAELHDRLLTLM
jgi:transcriptional regulator with XRE-family HTH domain